jgi:carbon monoxide dehydrogenase subunit G
VKIEREIDIAAPLEDVYRVVMDPRRLADWVTIHEQLVHAPRGQLSEGDELAQKLKVAGQTFKVSWTVVKAHSPRDVEWQGRGPMGTKARVCYWLEPDGDGTRFHYVNEYELPGGPLGKMGARIFERTAGKEADKSLERLKHAVESPARVGG